MFRKNNMFKGLLFRLTSLNVLMITLSILISSFAIYQTACLLVESMGELDPGRQTQFESLLLQYLIVFSLLTISIGSLLHFYMTKNLIRPIRQLIHSTKQVKEGATPKRVDYDSNNEVGELVDQYNDLLQQLETNNKLRKKMITDLSHEIRTPVQNLNGYLYALKNGDMAPTTEVTKSLFNESQRLKQLINQFDQLKDWDLIREESIIQKSKIDIANVIHQCIAVYQWNFENAEIPLDVKVEKCVIEIHEERIQQVINNLLDNALKYHEGQGSVQIKGVSHEQSYEFKIRSRGNEIPEPEHENIFKRYYRLQSSTSNESSGTGLGLAIVKEIIHKHNGKIGLNSTNHINEFWFSLPK
ncbi:sensor histidine kinase [Piscibacillus halophilus]|nr:HAMP domain-containing sensor histidine kinase [Piscibacillus halophilus]